MPLLFSSSRLIFMWMFEFLTVLIIHMRRITCMQRSLHSGRMKLRRCFASLLHVYNYVKKEGIDKEDKFFFRDHNYGQQEWISRKYINLPLWHQKHMWFDNGLDKFISIFKYSLNTGLIIFDSIKEQLEFQKGLTAGKNRTTSNANNLLCNMNVRYDE